MPKPSPIAPSPLIPAAAWKDSIIMSAAALFGKKWFNWTQARKNVANAGVSEVLIFKHFPSIEEWYAPILVLLKISCF